MTEDQTRDEQLAEARQIVRWTDNKDYYKAQIGKALVLYPNGSSPAIYEWCQSSGEPRLILLSLHQVRRIIMACEKSIGLKKQIIQYANREYADELNKALMRREHDLSEIERELSRVRNTIGRIPGATDRMLKLHKMKDIHMSALETIIGLRKHGEINIVNNVTVESDGSLVEASRKAKLLVQKYKKTAIETDAVITTDETHTGEK